MKSKVLKNKTSPLLVTVNDFMTFLKVVMVLVCFAYFFSGLTLVRPDEIAVVLRMGKLVGETPAEQIHKPGWLITFPKPFDQVIKIPNQKILQVNITELAPKNIIKDESGNISTIDPTLEGYCISGDENIYQTSLSVKFQISEPIKYVFNYAVSPHKIINDLIIAEMTCVSSKFSIDGILTKDKQELSHQVLENVQAKLDSINSGLKIQSLDITELTIPKFLKPDFEDVQSAFVDQHQYINKAKSRQEVKITEAQSVSQKSVNEAMAYKETVIADANANAGQFTQLLQAYESNPTEIATEMKSNTIKKIISKSGNLIVFPDVVGSQGNVTLLLGMNGSVLTKITTPEGYYEEDD